MLMSLNSHWSTTKYIFAEMHLKLQISVVITPQETPWDGETLCVVIRKITCSWTITNNSESSASGRANIYYVLGMYL